MSDIKKVSLYFTEGSSDKEYHAQIAEKDGGYVVNFQYGRRGAALAAGSKTASPVTLEAAEKVYAKLVKEKQGKGYTEAESGVSYTGTPDGDRDSGLRPQLLNSLDESVLAIYLNDSRHCAQQKFDGERRMIECCGGKVRGINKLGLAVPLPEPLANEMLAYDMDFTVDGELIGTTLYLFDLLRLRGRDMTGEVYLERYTALEENFGQGSPENYVVVFTAHTTTEKRALLKSLEDKGQEGMVFKDINARYTPSRPNTGGSQMKYKFIASASVIVQAVNSGKRSVALYALDGATPIALGNVTIPANHPIPAAEDIVEVQYLYAYKNGSLFQPVYKGKRSDIATAECQISQLKYKSESAAA